MAKSYLDITNHILGELNEVRLTSSNFANATNIQQYVKEAVNHAYMDMHEEEYKVPWLAANSGDSLNDYLGNAYVETVAGQRWYEFKPAATTIDDEYAFVDWEKITLTTEGVAGETAPYTIHNLKQVNMEDWKRYFATSENRDMSDSQVYGTPSRIIKHPSRNKFGLSSIPDKVYRIYFFAWDHLTLLSAYDDEVVIPELFVPTLEARVRYYAWQFKDEQNRSQAALADFKKGMKRLRDTYNPSSASMTDDRLWF